MQILNTRPADRAQPLTQALQQLGHQVYGLPLLELVARPLDAELKQLYQQLLAAECVVVVSPIAAELGVQYAQQCGLSIAQLQQLNWIAVGHATQKKLHQWGLASHCPEVENSEGMLALDFFKNCHQQTVAFWRGIGGRTFMMQQLSAQGCSVLNMLLYCRQMPDISLATLQAFGLQQCAVLITSEASWNNWLQLWPQDVSLQPDFNNFHYIVLGQRVTQVVKQDLQALGHAAQVAELEQLSAWHINQSLQQIQL